MNQKHISQPAINFDEVMSFLKSASTYELFRLKNYIGNKIQSSQRLEHIKSQLRPGQSVEYFSSRSQSLRQGVVCKTNIKYVIVQANDGSGRWKVPYYCININSRPIQNDIPTKMGSLNKNNLNIGDTVGFVHNGHDIVCRLTKLNLKTASLITHNNERWKVYYEHLFPIIEAESKIGETFDALPTTSASLCDE